MHTNATNSITEITEIVYLDSRIIIFSQSVPWWERESDVKHGDTCEHMNVWRME